MIVPFRIGWSVLAGAWTTSREQALSWLGECRARGQGQGGDSALRSSVSAKKLAMYCKETDLFIGDGSD